MAEKKRHLGLWLALGLVALTLLAVACGPEPTRRPDQVDDPLLVAAVIAFQDHAKKEGLVYRDLAVMEVERSDTEATLRFSAWVESQTEPGEYEQQVSTVRFVQEGGEWKQGQSLIMLLPPLVAARSLDEAELPRFWYGLAALDLQAERWTLAADRLARVVSLDPNFRDAQARLDEVRTRLLKDAEILFVSNRDGNFDLFTATRDGKNPLNLTAGTSGEWLGHWSPAPPDKGGTSGGQRVAFPSDRAGNWDIWVMDLAGSSAISLTAGPAREAEVAWSPDGQWLLFTSDQAENADLYLLPAPAADGPRPAQEPVQLTDDPGLDGEAAWSPDGRWIVFVSDRGEGEGRHLWLMPAPGPGGAPSGQEPLPLTSGEHNEWQPAWSPDGGWIAYTTDRNGRWDVYRLPAPVNGQPAASEPENLTSTPDDHEWAPVWSPDSRYLLLATDRDGTIHIYRLALAAAAGEARWVAITTGEGEDWPADWRRLP